MPDLTDQDENVQGHFRLAIGFLATAAITPLSTECEVRNAVSRSFYALLHVCHAWVAMPPRNVRASKRRQKKDLYFRISDHRGDESRKRLKRFEVERDKADYRPEVFVGDEERFRLVGLAATEEMRTEFNAYFRDVIEFVGEASDAGKDDNA